VFVESESARIGRLRVPPSLLERLHGRAAIRHVEMPLAARVALLLEDYAHFADDPDALCRQLETLVELQGHERVAEWQALAQAGAWHVLFERLMVEHYDPSYERSMRRHYAALADAPTVALADGAVATLDAAATALLEERFVAAHTLAPHSDGATRRDG
jgi:tRNA 2-selenouridine synthase